MLPRSLGLRLHDPAHFAKRFCLVRVQPPYHARMSDKPSAQLAADVFSVLCRSRATLERRASLGDALVVAQWCNRQDRVDYMQPGQHTLSVYLWGGHTTRLVGGRQCGAPGRYCLLPAEHESRWLVGETQRFVHLYVSPAAWAERVVRLLDAEPRAYTLSERIFAADPVLTQWAGWLERMDWQQPTSRLQAQVLSHGVLDHLLLQAARPRQRDAVRRQSQGGLAPTVRRRILAYIDARLADGDALTLGQLSELACLSPYHFARMFRLSVGWSVHAWITRCRIRRAQELLTAKRSTTLEHIAAECGLGSASHLARHFRRHVGATPGQWRTAHLK